MNIWFSIMQKVAIFALNWVYNFIDADHDGKISKSEINAFTKKVKGVLKR